MGRMWPMGTVRWPQCLPPSCSKDPTQGKLRPIYSSLNVGKALDLHCPPLSNAVPQKPLQCLTLLIAIQTAPIVPSCSSTFHFAPLSYNTLPTKFYSMVNSNFLKIKSSLSLALRLHLWSITIVLPVRLVSSCPFDRSGKLRLRKIQ